MYTRVLFALMIALIVLPAAVTAADITDSQIPKRETDPAVSNHDAQQVVTQAKMAQDAEVAFQQRLNPIAKTIDELSSSLAALRRSTSTADTEEVQQIEQKIGVAEQEVTRISLNETTPIAKLQASDLQDKLFQLRLSVEALKQRYGWSQTAVFGLDYFAGAASAAQFETTMVPKDYVVRRGDTISEILSSKLGGTREFSRKVDDSGRILAPALGAVSAAGKSVRQIESVLNSRYKREFPQLTISLSVEKMNPVTIRVAGAVARPGTYLMSPASTVFDALYRVGGPTADGTLRRMSIVRDGQPKRTLDLYDFLINGSKSQDFRLEDGDMLFVPPVGATVIIDGEVVRPGRYEPTFPLTLGAAIKMAGDAKASSYLQNVMIERIENNEYKVLLDVPVQEIGQSNAFQILPGDHVTVLTVRSEKTNRVSIEGPVNAPGAYGFKEQMKVSDLIAAAQGLSRGAEIYWRRGDIIRLDAVKGATVVSFDVEKALGKDPESDLVLRKLDRVFLYEPDQVTYRPNFVKIAGAVAKPGFYRRTEGMKISDLLDASGGVMPTAYLSRVDVTRPGADGRRELVRVDLTSVLAGSDKDNLVLGDRDEISIYTQDQVRTGFPMVRIAGCVQRPGLYDRTESMRLSDILFASGGLLPEASDTAEISHVAKNGDVRIDRAKVAELAAGSDDDVVLQDGDVVSVPMVNAAVRTPMTVTLTGEVNHPGTYVIDQRKTRLSDVIARAGGLTSAADPRCLIFLREKDSFQRSSQLGEVDAISEKMTAFVGKQFALQLAKATGKQTDHAGASSTLAGSLPIEPAVPSQDMKPTIQTEAPALRHVVAESFPEAPSPRDTAMGSRLGAPVGAATSSYKADDSVELGRYGRISVDLGQAMTTADSSHNVLLKSGDRICVQPVSETVMVMGAVLSPHCFVAERSKSISYYVDLSGGYTPDAAKRQVVVIHSNGDAVPAKAAKQIAAGDIIYVPYTGLIEAATKSEKVGSVTKIISDVLSSAFILTRF